MGKRRRRRRGTVLIPSLSLVPDKGMTVATRGEWSETRKGGDFGEGGDQIAVEIFLEDYCRERA